MNVIIQTVHALIYSIFISQALIMSLQNVAGMLMALILMNYTSKADDLFKKIFKFGGGDSLLGHTEGAADSFKQNMDAALGIAAGAKPAAKMLTNTPYGKVVKGAGKAAVAAGVGVLAGGRALYRAGLRGLAGSAAEEAEPAPEQGNTEVVSGDGEGTPGGLPIPNTAKPQAQKPHVMTDAELREANGYQLKSDMDEAKHAMKAEKKNPSQKVRDEKKQDYEVKRRNYNRFKALAAPTTGKIIAGHYDRLLRMENVFTTGKPTGKFAPFKTAWVAAMGSSHYDRKQGKWVNDGNSIFDQMRASELLGLTDKDKKLLKDFGGDMMQGLIGMGSLFIGMGTFVTTPKIGMALLAKGVSSTNKVFGKDTSLARTPAKYKFGRFSPQSIDTMRYAAIAKAQREHDDILAADLKKRHPNLVSRIKSGALKGVTVAGLESGSLLLTGSAGLAATAFLPTAAVVGGATMIGTRLTRNSKISGKLADIDKHHTKQQKELIDKFNKEADKEKENSSKAGSEYLTARFLDKSDDEYMDGEERKAAVEKAHSDAEYSQEKETIKAKTAEIDKDEINVTKKAELKGFKSEMIAAAMDKELDRIIAEMTAGGSIDIGEKKIQNEIIKRLGLSLESQKILEKGEQASRLLKGGEAELIRKVKIKTAVKNAAVEKAREELEKQLSPEERTSLESVVKEMMEEGASLATVDGEQRSANKLERLSSEDVIKRLQASAQDGSRQANPNDGSRQANSNDGAQVVKEMDPAKRKAIENYVRTVKETKVTQAVEIKGAVAHDVAQDIQARVERKGKAQHAKDTKEKLQQILSETMIDEEFLANPTATSGGKKTYTVTDSKGEVKKVTLSENEFSYANDVVKSLLELKRLNEQVLARDPDPKKTGPVRYTAMMQRNSIETIGMAENRKQEIELELEGVGENDPRMQALKDNTAKRQQVIDKNKKELSTAGPVVDIDYYINEKLFKAKGRKVR